MDENYKDSLYNKKSLNLTPNATVEYEDILQDRRNSSDLRWSAREWEAAVQYKYKLDLTRNELFQKVINSERVQYTIAKLSAEGMSKKKLQKKVPHILNQMGHTLDIGMIRKFAFTLSKTMKKIYGRILVNKCAFNNLQNKMNDTPVILMPTHRSYADFLLVSYIMFHYNLPFPVIAAGMDFMSMSIVGDMLRAAGAFYIKRSFVDDSLYWAVFQEYVQALISTSGQPLEFFLEGTRSRSGKSLPPKLGLLGCITECWLRGHLPDLLFVPISISYNRTLEEKLYAYELLGVPKPKESTSGLLKAMKILKEDFGDIYVHFGEPISTCEFLRPQISRHQFISQPFLLAPLTKDELSCCESFALHILSRLQQSCVVSVWSVTCLCLLQEVQRGRWHVPWQCLLQNVYQLWNTLSTTKVQMEKCDSIESALHRCITVHRDVIHMSSDENVIIKTESQSDAPAHVVTKGKVK